jgi:hypothetical protein
VELCKNKHVIRLIKSRGMKSVAELLSKEEQENSHRYRRNRGLSESVKKKKDR